MTFHIPFTRLQPFYILVGGILIATSVILLFTKGLNFETDFKGGIKLQYQFTQEVKEGSLRASLVKVPGIGSFSIQRLGEDQENRFVIKIELPENGQDTLSTQVTQNLTTTFGAEGTILEKEDSVGPKAGKELRRKGLLAIMVSWLLILIYIGWRFDFLFAPGAIVALIHDVIITLGAFALWQVDFSLTSVAALLTIVGYSINDTIIVYDRIRENTAKNIQSSTAEIMNNSINEVFSRTIITSLTVLFVVAVLFFVAEGEIKNFAFAMIVGAIIGTLSSIFVATPVYRILKYYFPGMGAAHSIKEEK
jgi:preprotein translocase subunit SecF